MASVGAIGQQAHTNMSIIREYVEAHASEERRQRIATYYPVTPAPNRDPLRFDALLAELLAGVVEIMAEERAANAEAAKPKRGPGRPRKDATEPTSQDADMDATETTD